MIIDTSNSTILEEEAGGPQVQDKPRLHNETMPQQNKMKSNTRRDVPEEQFHFPFTLVLPFTLASIYSAYIK